MSIKSEIDRISSGVSTAYSAAAVRGSDVSSTSVNDLADAILGIPTGGLTFTNVAVPESSFVADTTYSGYPYRAAIPLAGVTAGMMPDVVFSVEDAESGNFSPTSASYDGGVYIYAVEPASITIPTIHVGDQRQPFLEAVYPVGAIYLSTVATNPGTLFGFGTWEQIQDRFLLAAGSTYAAGSTGGGVTHNHKYGFQYGAYYSAISLENNDNAGLLNYDDSGNTSLATGSLVGTTTASMNGNTSASTKTDSMNHCRIEANTTSGNNMPPYLAVYVWQRTA